MPGQFPLPRHAKSCMIKEKDMKIRFTNNHIQAQPDPFMCKVQDGWAIYVTGAEGVGAYYCDTPFGQWQYKGIVCQKEGYREYWAPCMYYEDGFYYLYVSCRETGTEDAKEYLYVAKPAPLVLSTN